MPYSSLRSGFIVEFREHSQLHASKKKGNVDVLMTFTIMKELYERGDDCGKMVLVTGDGDFYELVQYLIEVDKFEKILHPAKQNASSLYKNLGNQYRDFLGGETVKKKIQYISPKSERGA